MRRRNLRLNALRAFESAARHGGLTKAAGELGVTHSAVSQQIKHLEDVLGVGLFDRTSQGVKLTPEGRMLLPTLSDCFDRIGAALDGLSMADLNARLIVTTTTTFASRWLIPRLNRWNQSPVRRETRVLPTLELLNLADGEADIAIRCGVPNWSADLVCEKLLSVTMTPVCSPATLRKSAKLQTPADVLAYTLIHADAEIADDGYEWSAWFDANGVDEATASEGISFHDPGLAIEAAVNGLGIAMGYLELIQTDIAAGRLICPFQDTVVHPYSYYLVYPKARKRESGIHAFREWIINEMRRVRETTPNRNRAELMDSSWL